MFQVFEYYSRYQGLRSGLREMPAWGKGLLMIAALPGILLAALSIAVFLVSLAALFLLALPVYRLVMAVGGGSVPCDQPVSQATDPATPIAPTPGRRRVDVTIIE